MKSQSGFTLIEMVMAIVIIAVMAAVGLPQFLDLKGDSRQAAVGAVAGTLGVAASTNAVARHANATHGVAIANCADVSAALAGGLPSGYTITSAAIAAGTSVNCTLTLDAGGETATFVGVGIN